MCSRRGIGLLVMASLCVALPARFASADEVHLVGGTMIEGKATRVDDKVVIDTGAGRLTLDAKSVERIEQRESAVERFERRYAALSPKAVAARLSLASFCRDHDMRAREEQLLTEVLVIDPDNAEARARLGYVRTASGWITREEDLRTRGYVKREGVYVTRAEAQELDAARARAAEALLEREAAELELERERLALAREKLELEEARDPEPPAPTAAVYGPPAILAPWPVYVPCSPYPGAGRVCPPPPHPPRYAPPPPFPIPGVRDPRDRSWPINGVRDPHDFL